MIKSSIAVYRNAYVGLSGAIWWLALVMFVNRAGTMVLPFLTVYLRDELKLFYHSSRLGDSPFWDRRYSWKFYGRKTNRQDRLLQYPDLEFIFEWNSAYRIGPNANILADWLLHVYYWCCRGGFSPGQRSSDRLL
jgi:hypothetical protein